MAQTRKENAENPPKLKITNDFQQEEFKCLVTFANAVLIGLKLTDKGVTDVQRRILLRMKENRKYLQVQAFRGCGKSTLAQIYILWKLYWDADYKVIILSASNDRAKEQVRFLRKTIKTLPFLKHMSPEKKQRDQANSFDVAGSKPSPSPSVTSKGIGGQVTGSRANLILTDDVEVSTNIGKKDTLQALNTLFNEAVHILFPENSKMLCLGTPHGIESFYNSLPQRGFTVHKYPLLLNWKTGHQERSADQTRFPMKVIRERQKIISESEFSLQYQLDTDTKDVETYPLKLEYLKILEDSPKVNEAQEQVFRSSHEVDMFVPGTKGNDKLYKAEGRGLFVPYQRKIMFVDPAGGGKDETAITICAALNGYIHCLGFWTVNSWSKSEIAKIAKLVEDYKVSEFFYESNFGDSMLGQLLKPYIKVPMTPVRSTKNKQARIVDTLLPLLEDGRIVFYEDTVREDCIKGHYSFFNQFVNVSKIIKNSLKHDDKLDCFAGACDAMKENVAVDELAMMQMKREELLQKELDEIAYGKSFGSYVYASRGKSGGKKW